MRLHSKYTSIQDKLCRIAELRVAACAARYYTMHLNNRAVCVHHGWASYLLVSATRRSSRPRFRCHRRCMSIANSSCKPVHSCKVDVDLRHAATCLGVAGSSCFSKLSFLNYKLVDSILHCIANYEDMSVKAVIAACMLRPTQTRRQIRLALTNNKI